MEEVILKPHSVYLAYPYGFIADVLDAQWIEIVLWDLEMYRESICFELELTEAQIRGHYFT